MPKGPSCVRRDVESAMTDTDRYHFVKQAQNGNAEAFGRLYAEIASELYRFALWYLKSPHQAEDAVQDACVKAFQGVGGLKKPDAFKSWFMHILSNCCKDILEKERRLRLVGEDDPALAGQAYYAAFSDGSVERYLDRLEDTDRRIVLLSVLGGYTSAELGKMLHMKAPTVRARLSRSLHALRQQMEADL